MRVNKYTVIPILILCITFLQGCVEPYYPELEDAGQSLVIDGLLSDREGYHQVRVSRSSAYNDPDFIPVSGCQVQVTDQYGNAIIFYENEAGMYQQWVPQDFLITGNQYKLLVSCKGKNYESSFQELLKSAPIGEVYYKVEDRETTDPAITLQGIQFYTDFDIPQGSAENYRWEIEETWEYRSFYPITFYWDGFRVLPPGSVNQDLFYCWNTVPIYNIITASSRPLQEARINGQPLHYVSNETDRLRVKYSLLVTQYGLSREAYEYWQQLEKLSQETGGLYDSQPPQLRGNISNSENNDEVVLGWFSVSGKDVKRFFIDDDFKFFFPNIECNPFLPLGGFPRNNPYYLVESAGQLMMANESCFDCTVLGGTTQKPDFWE